MAFDRSRGVSAIVVGAGINGLTAAATLARKGVAVTVLERAPVPGGMAAGAGGEIEIAQFVRGPHAAALAELGLAGDDLGLGAPVPTVGLDPDGRHVVMEGGTFRYADGTQHPDAAAFEAVSARLDRFARVLAPLLVTAPPRLGGWRWRAGAAQISRLARLGLDLRRLGKPDMGKFLRVALSNAHDVLLDSLPDGPAAGALALDAVLGCRMGPRSPGTVVTLLYRLMQGPLRRPERGMAGLSARLAGAAQARGAELRLGAEVAVIEAADDRACGAGLADGSRIPADTVLSSLGALPTLRLAGAQHFDAETCRRIRQIRAEGVTARLDLRVAAPLRIPGLDPSLMDARLVLAPSVAAVERAFDAVKYGQLSQQPVIEASLSPDRRRLSVTVQYVPFGPDDDIARGAVAGAVLSALAPIMPGLHDLIEQPAVLLPSDIASLTGAPGGHWHHGEIALDQLLTLRPANGVSHYALGLPGLFLCGAGAHPGGDITGLPGRNGAMATLAGVSA